MDVIAIIICIDVTHMRGYIQSNEEEKRVWLLEIRFSRRVLWGNCYKS